MENLEIKIKYLREGMTEIKKDPKGDLVDLYAAEDVFVPHMSSALIPLGVAMQLPKGYRADLCARSSLFNKWGVIVTNSIGKIDQIYCGDNDEWKLAVYCLDAKTIVNGVRGTQFKKGDKIAQFELVPVIMDKVKFKTVEILGNEDRNGFGSTGTR